MRGSAARGVLSGAVAGVGAWVAHDLVGGEVTPLAGSLVLALSVALGPVLLVPSRTSSRAPGCPARDATGVDPLRVAALALLSQGVWHLGFMLTAPPPGAALPTTAGPDHAVLMLATHLLVAFVATTVAVGLDRALVRTAVRLAATLLPRPVVAVTTLPVPTRQAPVRAAVPPPLASARLLTRALRGPPAGVRSASR